MKIISNNKGLSLVEALVGIIVISVAGVGLLKVSQQTILTSQITETHRSTSKLKNQLYSVLNDPDDCNNNLKPDQLSDPDSKTGKLTDDTFKTLKVGSIEGGLIEITRMALKNPPQDNSDNTPPPQDNPDNTPPQNSKIFYLYYKYNSPALGDNQQRTNDPCTEQNVSGCYYLSCEMQYDCTGSTCNKCMPLNCGFSEDVNLSNFDCPPGKFLVGGTRNNSLCVGCDEGEHLIGTKISNGNPPEPICLKKIDCEAGKVPVGIKLEEGKYVMDCMNLICPQGQYLVLRAGEDQDDPPVSKCEKICHGGKGPDENDECVCPEGFKEDPNGNCICIGLGENSFINEKGECACNSLTGIKNSQGTCECKGRVAGNGRCFCDLGQNPEENNCMCGDYPTNTLNQFTGTCTIIITPGG